MKTILISGVCGGLGSIMAHEFLKLGHKVIGLDIKDNIANGKIEFYQCDASDREKLIGTFDKIISDHGVPDIIVNNLGISHIGLFTEMNYEDFQKIIDINLMSVISATHYWLSKMETKGSGNISTVSSVAGYSPSALLSAYCTSKFALVGFIESLRLELAANKSPVRLTLISPGFVKTPLVKLGQNNGFPKELDFLLGDPTIVGKEMALSILKGKSSFTPTFNGKTMKFMNRFFPSVLSRANLKLAKKMLSKDSSK